MYMYCVYVQECYTPVCKRTAHVDKPSSRGTKHSEGQRKGLQLEKKGYSWRKIVGGPWTQSKL